MSNEIYTRSAAELSLLLEQKALSSVDITKAFIERSEAVEPQIKAFLHRDAEDALKQAQESDKRRALGKSLSPLDGIPVAIKDLIAVEEQPLTCGSRMLENFVSPYDASSIQKLKASGAVLWGRLNMDEFAMGSSCENSAFQKTSNPWNTDCVPGGSSGGSAAAVAAGEAPLTLGSDTGGSIRQPASFCGIVGLKPTYGLVSRFGLVAYASSLDQIGPLGRTVEDTALLLQQIAGYDSKDSTSFKTEIPNYRAALESDKKWKIGLDPSMLGEGLHPEIRANIEGVLDYYKDQGAEIVDISLPHASYAIPTYYVIATAEASSNLARFDGIRYSHRSKTAKDAVDLYFQSRGEGFGEEVKRRIILGTYVLSSGYYDAYYLRAQKVRNLIRKDYQDAFQKVDAIISPTCPNPAFKLGENMDDPLKMYLQDIYTISVNLSGLPGISVPSGFTEEKLPIGFQLVGKPYQEAELMSMAHLYDKAYAFGKSVAPL